ncbi:MAG: hypothetical protein HKP12_04040 [Gammaproteobacteria bacterium]|nr:hypothetical protein [Gammaproteobacteria bacterium]
MFSRSLTGILLALSLCLTASTAWSDEPVPLTREQLLELVYDKTVDCRKEKDQSTCVNYFSDEGVMVQVLHKNTKRKDGRWFLDDSDRLCILWDGKFKPLCFVVIKNDDGTFNMIKSGKHMSTMLKFYDGNSEKL